jgi:photosystem II stability/assembly factor-like uncharacterized protein
MSLAVVIMAVLALLAQSAPDGVPLPTSATLSTASDSVVWSLVAGRLLFRSTDQGQTWEQRPLPPGYHASPAGISFVDDQEGWVAAAGSPATQCQAQYVAIWHTTDAGASWQPVQGAGIADSQCKDSVSFTDSMHGFLSAWDPNHPPVIYWTQDGGETWAPSQPLPDPPAVTTGPGGFELTAGRVQGFGPTLLVPVRMGHGELYVYESDDGGASWNYSATAPLDGASIGLATATHWLLLINPSQSQETSDAGATWYLSSSDYSQAAPIPPDVVFGSPDVGYATVRGGIQRSVDGGQHWTVLYTPGTCGTDPPCP